MCRGGSDAKGTPRPPETNVHPRTAAGPTQTTVLPSSNSHPVTRHTCGTGRRGRRLEQTVRPPASVSPVAWARQEGVSWAVVGIEGGGGCRPSPALLVFGVRETLSWGCTKGSEVDPAHHPEPLGTSFQRGCRSGGRPSGVQSRASLWAVAGPSWMAHWTRGVHPGGRRPAHRGPVSMWPSWAAGSGGRGPVGSGRRGSRSSQRPGGRTAAEQGRGFEELPKPPCPLPPGQRPGDWPGGPGVIWGRTLPAPRRAH